MSLFQTYPRGVEVAKTARTNTNLSFRRTLVGLKLVGVGPRGDRLRAFQTYPRGVEVTGNGTLERSGRSFRRTLVGLKLSVPEGRHRPEVGFRRTLVGLKLRVARESRRPGGVSDVPSWG